MEWKDLSEVAKEEFYFFSRDFRHEINISMMLSTAPSEDALVVMIDWIRRQSFDPTAKPKSVIIEDRFFRCPIDKVTRKPRKKKCMSFSESVEQSWG